jgi:CHAD domain-containing protein
MTSSQSVREAAISPINQYFSKATQHEQAVLQDEDPEELHQMRVAMRRLRTALQVFAPAIALPPAAQERQVARVARHLGQLRDLDVITQLLVDQYLPDLPEDEGKILVRALKSLKKQRKRTYKKVKRTLKGDRYQALKAAFTTWGQAPSCRVIAGLPLATVLPDLTLPLVSRLWLHPGWLIATQVETDRFYPHSKLDATVIDRCVKESNGVIHSLRKQVKRVRYQLSLVSQYYGDRLKPDLKRLQSLQEALGQLQDTWVLANFLSRVIPQWETQLPTLRALLSDSRQRAWIPWQTAQGYYLDPEHRSALRQILLSPGSGKTTATSQSSKKARSSSQRSSTSSSSTTKATGKKTTRKGRSKGAQTAASTSANSPADPSAASPSERKPSRRRTPKTGSTPKTENNDASDAPSSTTDN